MKRSSLTTSVVAGLAGVAGLVNVSSALNVNPDGLGQVLIYPYYTVNGGNSTLVSVVNTTDQVKGVKVRFLEGRNSQEVLDFNLYLSPFDVWTGSVVDVNPQGVGQAVLTTLDTSCTVPGIPAAGAEFRAYQYRDNDDGPWHLERTREGHLEMIEMAVVVDPAHAAWATHNANGVPANCAALQASWNGGQWSADPEFGVDIPNGGLFGGAAIIDTANGTNLSYNADAIEGFYFSSSGLTLHADPGSVDPSLSDAQDDDGAGATAVIFDNGTLYAFTFTTVGTSGRDAVSAAFMHNEIYNEYVTGGILGAESEWVITFPTKRLHVEETTLLAKLPFTSTYLGDDLNPDPEQDYANLVGACEPIDIAFWDREEGEPGDIPDDLDFSPPPPVVTPPGLNLCFEAQVVTFNQPTAGEVLFGNQPSGILGSWYPRNLNLCKTYSQDGTCASEVVFNQGWMRMTLGDPQSNFLYTEAAPAGTDPNILVGLPATGFWAANYVNDNSANGLLANFSGLHKHRADRETVVGTVSGTEDTGYTYTALGGSGI